MVSSITQGTNQYGRPPRRTYDDLLIILQEIEKAVQNGPTNLMEMSLR